MNAIQYPFIKSVSLFTLSRGILTHSKIDFYFLVLFSIELFSAASINDCKDTTRNMYSQLPKTKFGTFGNVTQTQHDQTNETLQTEIIWM